MLMHIRLFSPLFDLLFFDTLTFCLWSNTEYNMRPDQKPSSHTLRAMSSPLLQSTGASCRLVLAKSDMWPIYVLFFFPPLDLRST